MNSLDENNQSSIEWFVAWILKVSGGVVCCSVLTIFLPVSWMTYTHGLLGLGEMPIDPIVIYMARSLSAMYLAHGALVLFVGLNVKEHWNLVPLIASINCCLGVILLLTDLSCPMPWYWTAMEGPPIFLIGALIFALWRRANRDRTKG